jgi:hypothetical protein
MLIVARFLALIVAGMCSLGRSTVLIAQSAVRPGEVAGFYGNPWSALLPDERGTLWNPGMRGAGGIPVRTTICNKLSPQGADDTARIQNAINTCPVGQVVQLEAGTFRIIDGNFLLLDKGVTLRGSGPGQTVLSRTDGAKPYRNTGGSKPAPLDTRGLRKEEALSFAA